MGVIGELLKGLRVTGSQMFKPRVTVKYPAVFREKPERFHGRHVLNRYPDGMEKCIGCELCAGACPARGKAEGSPWSARCRPLRGIFRTR